MSILIIHFNSERQKQKLAVQLAMSRFLKAYYTNQ